MTLEKQCCTLAQAKRLKELHVINNSIATWYCNIPNTGTIVMLSESGLTVEQYPAYTVAELGDLLPTEYYTVRFSSNFWEWSNDVEQVGNGPYRYEAEARADLLIHLLETENAAAHENEPK